MSMNFSFGRMELGRRDEGSGASRERDPAAPFRVLVLGDFSGRANRGLCQVGAALAERKPIAVDRDNFDEVLAKMGVAVRFTISGAETDSIALQFSELDDFHPDRLFERIDLFDSLRQLRRQLGNPKTFDAAAERVRSWSKPSPQKPAESPATPAASECAEAPPSAGGEDLIAEMLSGAKSLPAGPVSSSPSGGIDWNTVIQDVVKPYVVAGTDPQQPELIAQVDEATSRLMATVLGHPQFQGVEAAWRGLYQMIRRLETDVTLKLYLIDISKEELVADLSSSDDLAQTGLYKLLVGKTVGTPGAPLWAVLAGNYIFDPTVEEMVLMGKMATLAEAATAPFVTAGSPRIVGCESFAKTPDPDDWASPLDAEAQAAWNALRKLPQAEYLCVAMPRFLLRQPYGSRSDPTERFEFEELADKKNHEAYLWGNPSIAIAILLGQSFTHYGWELRPGIVSELDGLPIFVYEDDGDSEVKPCAEALLTMRAAERILDVGVTPLLSVQHSDSIRVGSIRSVADPVAPLAGRWA